MRQPTGEDRHGGKASPKRDDRAVDEAANEVDLNRPSLLSGRPFFFGLEKGASRIATYKVYQADIQQPRKASLMVYRDSRCWITLADSEGAETTIAVNLDDEGDRKFADQLCLVTGVLAVLMPDDGARQAAAMKPPDAPTGPSNCGEPNR